MLYISQGHLLKGYSVKLHTLIKCIWQQKACTYVALQIMSFFIYEVLCFTDLICNETCSIDSH